MKINKLKLTKEIYDFIAKADKEQLLKMQSELSKEMDQGLLVGIEYEHEIKLINYRLGTTATQ